MKKFKIEIPEGYEAKLENGQVVCYPIEKEECKFEIGDVFEFAGCNGALRLFEGVDQYGHVLRRGFYYETTDIFELSENIVVGDSFNNYTKSNPEREKLFKQKCLENGVWFDKVNKKWIELKDKILSIDTETGFNYVFIFDKYECEVLWNKEYIGCYGIGNERRLCYDCAIVNISEATEEEKQSLFDALAKKGKQWNAEKKCVEDLKWKPKDGKKYWYIASDGDIENEIFDSSSDWSYIGEGRIEIGNCFKTQEECEKYAEYMKQCSLNYKP